MTKFHDGTVFQAALVAGSSRAAEVIGRWVAAIRSATSSATSAANTFRNSSWRMVRSLPVPPSGSGTGTLSSAAPSCAPGNLAASSPVLSPGSRMELATSTGAVRRRVATRW
ncbi:hypothetical protein [Actinomycetospora chlora]|uniref:hypothetical protein n=1 Tax=Actinomycetospora chlora TaxID=663608 RepID=UPI0031F0D9AF